MRTTTTPARRGRRALIAVGAVVAVLASGVPATAATVTTSTVPVKGWSTNGPVYATAIVGNTVYAGGSFTQVRSQGATQTVARTNLAAFDRTTGAVRTGFTANTNGVVRALDSDGTRLFVGGSFTTVNAVTRQRLAALDPATGAVNTGFVANAGSHVYALARRGARLFVGGAFSSIGGKARSRIAAVSTTTGAVDATFNPGADSSVAAIAVSPDGATVYAGGQFTTIGGALSPYLGTVSGTTGVATGLVFAHMPRDQVITLDIAPTGSQLFVGSAANRAAAYDTVSGKRRWYVDTDGDVQAIRYSAGNVFFGFHDGYLGDTTAHLLAADAATGLLEPWQPKINSFWGVWAIAASTDALAIGGEFTTFSGVSTQGIAILPTTVAPPPPPPPSGAAVTADTYVNTDSPTKNYGAAVVLKLHSPTAEYRPLVQFTIGGLSAKPKSVKLRLFVTDTSASGGSWYPVANTWTESTVTWTTAPALGAAPAATVGLVTAGTWVDVDLTSAIAGNGTYSFMATSPSTNTAQFSSREGANPPEVVVVP
jgi:hypothetical protein